MEKTKCRTKELYKIFWHFFNEDRRMARKDKRKNMKFKWIIFAALGFIFSAYYAQSNAGERLSFSDVIISKTSIPFTAIVDSSSIIDNQDNHLTPTFRYKYNELCNLSKKSILFAGFDAHWQLHMSNFNLHENINYFHIPSNINFVVHSPARIGIDSVPDNYDLMLEIEMYEDSCHFRIRSNRNMALLFIQGWRTAFNTNEDRL